ncbi:hypothetical protein FRC09_017607 [Ceratobasidium sp. 395]|nr:hypothetical protein FRC09_017607 [Ceratobasidium sp. 395]
MLMDNTLFYVSTRAEREHYDRHCAWAGVRAGDIRESATGVVTELYDEGGEAMGILGWIGKRLARALQVERQLDKFIERVAAATIQPGPQPSKASKPLKPVKRNIAEP